MATKELHSVITIDNEDYSITANKVAQSLTIGEKTYDGSEAVQITSADLGIDNAVKTTRTISTGDGLSGGGDLSTDRTFSVVVGNGIKIVSDAVTAKAGNGITVDSTGINHADTSSQESITANGRKYVTGVALDTYGHVTGLTTGTETVTDTNQKIKVGNTTFGADAEVNLVAGSNVAIDVSDNTITISATGGTSTVTAGGYLGTVSALTGLSTTAKAGDFYRVITAFTFGSETAHVGDILIATKDSPGQNTADWDVLHAESIASFSSIVVNGQPAVTADHANDALTLASGTGIAIKTDDTNDKVTIEHTTSGVAAGTYQSVTVNAQGHVTGGSTLISHGEGDPSTSTTSQYYFKY